MCCSGQLISHRLLNESHHPLLELVPLRLNALHGVCQPVNTMYTLSCCIIRPIKIITQDVGQDGRCCGLTCRCRPGTLDRPWRSCRGTPGMLRTRCNTAQNPDRSHSPGSTRKARGSGTHCRATSSSAQNMTCGACRGSDEAAFAHLEEREDIAWVWEAVSLHEQRISDQLVCLSVRRVPN